MYYWEGKRILIVEDDLVTYEYFNIVLRKTGVQLLHATNGEQAVKLCREDKNIDLVLMDIQLPVLDGYTATRQIKSLERDIPVVAQTAYAMEDDEKKCKQAGCDDYLAKPIKKDDLLKMLNKYLNREGE